MRPASQITPRVGKHVIDIITSGMYSDPRMSIREYVQNATDSIDDMIENGSLRLGDAFIRISIDGKNRILTIEDNGAGVSEIEVEDRLGSIGASYKNSETQRGFRGIGRLAGLAYCDRVLFETRSARTEEISVVEWNGEYLSKLVGSHKAKQTLNETIRKMARTWRREPVTKLDPDHFFRVTMVNVHRFYDDAIMNPKDLQAYLSQTAPVRFDLGAFPFGAEIEHFLSDMPGYRCYNLFINGKPIYRPHSMMFNVAEKRIESINGVEVFQIDDDAGGLLCKGWYAKTSLNSALTKDVTMRGIRVRQGNLAVGDENVLRDLYTEARFASWHIGELHVHPRLKLNARRDGFEHGQDYEVFLEKVRILCRNLSHQCRASSKSRSSKENAQKILKSLRRDMESPVFVDDDHRSDFLCRSKSQLRKLVSLSKGTAIELEIPLLEYKLSQIEAKPMLLMKAIDGRRIRYKNGRRILSDVSRIIATHRQPFHPEDLLREIILAFSSNGTKSNFRIPFNGK